MLLRKKSVSIGFSQIARHSRSCGTIDVHSEQLQHERWLPPARVQRRWPRWIGLRPISRSCNAAALVQGCHQQWSRVRPHVRRGTSSTPFGCCFGAGPRLTVCSQASQSLRISTSCWMDALQFTEMTCVHRARLRSDFCFCFILQSFSVPYFKRMTSNNAPVIIFEFPEILP